MNNSMKKKNNLITPEKAAYYLPVFISSGIAILIIIFYVFPHYIKTTKVNLELIELIKKKNDLDNLKSEYKLVNQKFSKLNKKRSRIIELISGKSNLDTLIAQIGKIGKNNNIEFVSIIPKEVTYFDANNSEQDSSTVDPLLVEGTKKYLIDLKLKTDFVNLLSFLREVEFQENTVLIENIEVRSNNQKNDEKQGGNLQIKLMMKIYGKI